ncbi:cell envelope integrity EipB family protein [Methylobacterium sp. J-068]|uniref:cell envelope integrity EipB family protein n=1 Tax=Methylobacterium sp. J-068 TaxID=2836649 RepID=UPI001FB8D42F|nr:cell envelope integrity EipB family protein [Methylobacterium sp. J-068]MCJ2034900.1 cell envelope integrity EipB family protein [Methylobacterium sp. J-068]
MRRPRVNAPVVIASVAGGLVLFASAAGAAAPITLANHRAVYDLSLAESSGTRAVESARGRIVIDFSGDACKGYTMQTRQVTVLESGETGSRTSDLRNTTFESGDGRSYRFKTDTALNGTPGQAVDGTAEATPNLLKVKLKDPKRDQFQTPGEVLFPTLHMRRLIQAARDGQSTVSVKVFDGSDDGRKVYDTLAVIGRQASTGGDKPSADQPASDRTASDKPARDKPLKDGAMATMPHWPVTLSYYVPGEGERTPVYVLGFDLYENGVSGALRLNYGEFAVVGDLTRLDTIPTGNDCHP